MVWALHSFRQAQDFFQCLHTFFPSLFVHRRKRGFGIPVARWFRNELKDLLHEKLGAARLGRQGLFRPGYVAGLVADHMAGRHDHRKPLWTLLMFQLWHDRYLS